jgi:hypothetical protein
MMRAVLAHCPACRTAKFGGAAPAISRPPGADWGLIGQAHKMPACAGMTAEGIPSLLPVTPA